MTRTSIGNDHILLISVIVDSSLNTVPRILNIIKISPQITSVDDGGVVGLQNRKNQHCINLHTFLCYRHSTVCLVNRPGAGIDHGSPCLIEPVSELWISFVHVIGMRVATIQLDIVNIPACECLRVFLKYNIQWVNLQVSFSGFVPHNDDNVPGLICCWMCLSQFVHIFGQHIKVHLQLTAYPSVGSSRCFNIKFSVEG